ncbi:MAG TPA: phosphatase PAP2 family protein [Edaphocola sp.]|nr:phosphatase PAP2 family protein [Edaphocola sp.]
MRIRSLFFFFIIFNSFFSNGQKAVDSLCEIDKSHHFTYKKLIAPSALITLGSITAFSKSHDLDLKIKNYSQSHFATQTGFDDYLQYLPATSVYALNFASIKGKHGFMDRSILFLSSQMITGAIVFPIKYLSHQQRPNQSNYHSFPSGHTALSFSGAHFLFREYRDKNIWLALSGYPVALAVGALRISNNKHWFSDVMAGAGIGILSTELAYWAFPSVKKVLHIGWNQNRIDGILLPNIGWNHFGLSWYMSF